MIELQLIHYHNHRTISKSVPLYDIKRQNVLPKDHETYVTNIHTWNEYTHQASVYLYALVKGLRKKGWKRALPFRSIGTLAALQLHQGKDNAIFFHPRLMSVLPSVS